MCKRILSIILSSMILIGTTLIPWIEIEAGTVYLSDGLDYEEGYIIVGESHVEQSAIAFSQMTDANKRVEGLEQVTYHYMADDSIWSFDGFDNTFTMFGNLFFVYEGNEESERMMQISKEYIYSDGEGNRGVAVEKIHEIIDKNPNIKHWNIISYQGAVAMLDWKKTVPYYISSYHNWIDYEFPNANIYFVSHSHMTKFYRSNKTAYKFDEAIQAEFSDNYFDYTDFYNERKDTCMIDTIHWDRKTYVELFSDVIRRIQE